ncbi:hypothetical protein [Roseomonas rosulenta]|nr:hypothetical protein [Roseomonas rosulenta]
MDGLTSPRGEVRVLAAARAQRVQHTSPAPRASAVLEQMPIRWNQPVG